MVVYNLNGFMKSLIKLSFVLLFIIQANLNAQSTSDELLNFEFFADIASPQEMLAFIDSVGEIELNQVPPFDHNVKFIVPVVSSNGVDKVHFKVSANEGSDYVFESTYSLYDQSIAYGNGSVSVRETGETEINLGAINIPVVHYAEMYFEFNDGSYGESYFFDSHTSVVYKQN